jgi:hypothetical protein
MVGFSLLSNLAREDGSSGGAVSALARGPPRYLPLPVFCSGVLGILSVIFAEHRVLVTLPYASACVRHISVISISSKNKAMNAMR